jgi:sugar/nucleoside kinase (ribokinase family)
MEVLSLITENGQRSFFSAGPQLRLLPAHLEADIIAQSDYLFIEGYLLFDQAAAVHQAVKIARAVGTKVILTLAVDAVVRHAWPEVAAVIEHGVDLIIANDQELAVLLEQTRIHAQAYGQKFAEIVERTPRLITHGAKGAEFRDAAGHTTFTPTPPVAQVVDTTGAGDGFAAGFLHGYLVGQPIEAALLKGHEIAGKVIGQTGARLLLV